jgi:predicted nucleic acid-binding protein
MIYIDTSVALARLFGEDRRPSDEFWSEPLHSSRLLQYETWTRVNARGYTDSEVREVRVLLDGITFIELHAPALERALTPLPLPVRTLDALHLATMHFLKQQGLPVRLASYDSRLLAAAQSIGIDTLAL